MPFVNRHASPFAPPRSGLLRRHPFIIATGAATAGVLLGGYVAVQLLGTPEKQGPGVKPVQAAVVQPKPAAPPIAETTGSAPTESAAAPAIAPTNVATTDCSRQTWPNLTRDCMKNGGERVTPSDKPDRPATTASNPPPAAAPAI